MTCGPASVFYSHSFRLSTFTHYTIPNAPSEPAIQTTRDSLGVFGAKIIVNITTKGGIGIDIMTGTNLLDAAKGPLPQRSIENSTGDCRWLYCLKVQSALQEGKPGNPFRYAAPSICLDAERRRQEIVIDNQRQST